MIIKILSLAQDDDYKCFERFFRDRVFAVEKFEEDSQNYAAAFINEEHLEELKSVAWGVGCNFPGYDILIVRDGLTYQRIDL